MESQFRVKDGRWYYYGPGAAGLKWYNMGLANEVVSNCFGYDTELTAEEAIRQGVLEVSKHGQPYIIFEPQTSKVSYETENRNRTGQCRIRE